MCTGWWSHGTCMSQIISLCPFEPSSPVEEIFQCKERRRIIWRKRSSVLWKKLGQPNNMCICKNCSCVWRLCSNCCHHHYYSKHRIIFIWLVKQVGKISMICNKGRRLVLSGAVMSDILIGTPVMKVSRLLYCSQISNQTKVLAFHAQTVTQKCWCIGIYVNKVIVVMQKICPHMPGVMAIITSPPSLSVLRSPLLLGCVQISLPFFSCIKAACCL